MRKYRDIAKLIVTEPYPTFETNVARWSECGELHPDDDKWFKAWIAFDRIFPEGGHGIRNVMRAAHFHGFSKGYIDGLKEPRP